MQGTVLVNHIDYYSPELIHVNEVLKFKLNAAEFEHLISKCSYAVNSFLVHK